VHRRGGHRHRHCRCLDVGAVRHEGDGGVRTIEVEPLSTKGRHDDDLMPAVDRVTRRAGIGPMDLGVVAFSAGPGGFTGLRIAATVAKVLAEVTGAKVVPVPSAVAASRHLPAEAFPAVVLLASKRGTAHATTIDADGWSVRASSVVTAETLELAGVRSVVCDQHAPEEFVSRATSAGLACYRPTFSAAHCLVCVPRFSAVDPVAAGPIYAREPEAVRKWRELGRSSG
ncbi:MAG: tRNA (adenosine(37)-N6)-threonylcarbamoyltransferase complex dimerization subunit type 1 TsaB, partial [Phycisphaerales bacterium]